MKKILLLFIGLFTCFGMFAQTSDTFISNVRSDKNLPNEIQKTSVIDEILSLTNGAGEDVLGAGKKTNDITDPNTWRWAENYFGYTNLTEIISKTDDCGVDHIYAVLERDSHATIEYQMKFGDQYSQLVLRGIGAGESRGGLEIYIDKEYVEKLYWESNKKCNNLFYLTIPNIKYGIHTIAFVNPMSVGVKSQSKTNYFDDGNFYFDALMVIPTNENGIPVFVSDDIQAAVNDNPPGTTFKIKATDWNGINGVHRMQQIIPKDRNSFIGENGAIMNGSVLLTSWNKDGTHWWHMATGQIPRIINGKCEGYDTFGTGPCTFPEDLYKDDNFMSQVETIGELSSGKFYFDYAGSKVYIADDPSGHKMEFSSKHFAFGYDTGDLGNKPTGVTIKNLIIEKYACPAQCGAIGYFRPADGWIIEDNEVRLNHGVGIKFRGGVTVKNNHIHHNGQMGIGCGDANSAAKYTVGPEYGWAKGNGGTGSLVEKNEINNNGVLGFDPGWEGGGSKFGQATDLTLRENTVHHNNGFGLWGDFSFTGLLYENNVVEHNLLAGIHHEISDDAIISGNKLHGNGNGGGNDTRDAQILIVNSSNVEIRNNDVIAGENFGGGIFLNQDDRNREGVQMYTHNVYVHHNKITFRGSSGIGVCGGQAGRNDDDSWSLWNRNDFWLNGNNHFDYNTYFVDNLSSNHWRWDADASEKWPPYMNFAGFQAEGQELNGLCYGDGARVMYFNDGSESSVTTLVHPVVFGEADNIDFSWTDGTPDIKIGSRISGQENNFSARYEGTIKVENEGDYTFRVTADDGVRFQVKGANAIESDLQCPVEINRWVDDATNANVPIQTETCWFNSWKKYPFRLEYFHRGMATEKDAMLKLEWKVGDGGWEVVPRTAIGPPLKVSGFGLQGSYYNDPDMSSNPVLVRIDQQINFNWDKYVPDSRMNNDGTFAVVWEGKIRPLYAGSYYFFTRFNSEIESMKIWFDGNLLTPEEGQRYQVRYLDPDAAASDLHDIKIEYRKFSNKLPSSNVMLEWESVDNGPQDFELVPPYCLYLPDNPKAITKGAPENGLMATYYNIKSDYIRDHISEENWENDLITLIKNNSTDLEKALEDRVIDHANFLNFNWWAGSPDYRIGADYFVAEWNGNITLPEGYPTGVYSFKWSADNIGCLILGNEELTSIDNNEEITQKTMLQNRQHTIRAILLERGGSASAKTVLEWFHIPDFSREPEFSLMKSKEFGSLNDTTENEYKPVPPKAYTYPNIENTQFKLLVFGEDRSSTASILKSLGYDVSATSEVNYLGESNGLSRFDQIWYFDYKKVPDGKGKKNLQDYMLNGGKILFVGENYQSANSAYPLWRDSLFNALGAGNIKQSQSNNPAKIGFYFTNPDHILSQSPFTVASVKHLSTGNGAFESTGNGTVIAGTEPGGKGYPVAVAFDYGELRLAPNSQAVVYLNSNNGENWDLYAANIAEYFKQPIPETVLAVQDGYGSPGSTGKVVINMDNTQQVAGVQFILRDIPNFLSVNEVKTTSRSTGFETGFNEDGTGTPIIIIYNTSGKVISQGEGPIAEITYEVSSNAPIGSSSELQLSDVILSDPKGSSVPVDLVNGAFYFFPVKGDVNGDGMITITDIVRTIFIILKKLEPTEIEMYAADCNSDEHIDILDVVCIVNLIYNNPQQQPGLLVKSQSGNTIELETENLLSGTNNKTIVQANLTDEIAGLQLRISYDPKNLTLGEPAATSRTSGMTLSTQVKDGELIVLMYSLNGSVVKSGDGPILSIPSSVKPDAQGTTGLQLKDVILVGTDAREIPVSIITGIDDLKESMPNDYSLYQNYPNPFSSETVIKYGLPHSANVNIKVYNSLGQVIRELVSDYREAGVYTVTWNGKDSHDLSVSPGIYIYEFNADGNFIGKKKMVVLK